MYVYILPAGMSCLGENTVPGGVDTNLADHMVEAFCGAGSDIQVLDSCGGHAVPYHYHERMSCLYTSDPLTNHSTRIGTAGDGNGMYGPYIEGGVLPQDVDACGGRFGVTPDSNGEIVYYYPITAQAPFSIGCYGPVDSVAECRALYPDTCGDATVVNVTTVYGTGEYTLDCPCFDANESNVLGTEGRPLYLAALPTSTSFPTTISPTTSSQTTNPSPAPASDDPLDGGGAMDSTAVEMSSRLVLGLLAPVLVLWLV